MEDNQGGELEIGHVMEELVGMRKLLHRVKVKLDRIEQMLDNFLHIIVDNFLSQTTLKMIEDVPKHKIWI